MPSRRPRKPQPARSTAAKAHVAVELRIVGGQWRGRKLDYQGDPRTRPMKDRVRENLFNLLGPNIRGMHAWDLFAGTGALALEALSRGATGATLVEQHAPTARTVRANAERLGCEDRVQIIAANAFHWVPPRQERTDQRWLIFFSPPFAFYRDAGQQMLELIARWQALAPAGSLLVVESDTEFDTAQLPGDTAWQWRVRDYPPARLAIGRQAPAVEG